jgi:putative ABC transport system permease protein
MKKIENTWSRIAPDLLYKYSFLDEDVSKSYKEDRRWNSIITGAAGLAIIIALLGLFGLSTLEVSQRRKEIGIRKVLGASERNIILMLTRQIMLLVVGAGVVAAPAAWLLGRRWLDEFAYRIEIGPGLLALAGVMALILAVITVGGLAWRAATSNPVDSIRYE